MATSVNLRKMLHRKAWEFCTPSPVANAAGGFVVSDKSNLVPGHDCVYYVGGVSAIYNYNADEDGWMQLPNSGLTGTFAAGSCGEFRALGAMGGTITQTATAGSTTALTTNRTIVRSLATCPVRVVAGTGVGYSGTVSHNTIGANAVLTVTPASAVAFDNTTQYQVCSGSLWFFVAGTSAVGFGVYDRATNAWTSRSVTGLPTSWGTDAQLVSTPGCVSNNGSGFVNGTASSGASSTLTDSSKAWPTNGWTNFQVRIVSGTGAGQIRSIASNTATVLTVGVAWTVTPDGTSVYRIEGNDDYIYLAGNNAVTLYRFAVSSNAWSTLSPGTARGGNFAAGGTLDWVDAVSNSKWTDESYTTMATGIVRQNGRYLYAFRGGATGTLDAYDIASNVWVNGISYGNALETFTTGSCSVDMDGKIYIQKEATGRIFRLDVANSVLEPFATNLHPQSTATAGDKMFFTSFSDGGTTIRFFYTMHHTRAELLRMLVI